MNVRLGFPLRVQVRPFRASDDPWLEAWFPEAAAAVWGAGHPCSDCWTAFRSRWFLREDQARKAYILSVPPDTIPIGVIAWESAGCGGFAVLRFLALARGWRGRGYGAEAVYMMEAMANAPAVCLPLPPGNGRALYFWLRLGYRPLLQEEQEAFMRAEGGAWMLRTLTEGGGQGHPQRLSDARREAESKAL